MKFKPCEHMIEVLKLCEALGIEIGGCGCCGSPDMYCKRCKASIDYVSVSNIPDYEKEVYGGNRKEV